MILRAPEPMGSLSRRVAMRRVIARIALISPAIGATGLFQDAPSSQAQSVRINSRVSCASCTISLERSVRLDGGGDSRLGGMTVAAARDSDGVLYIADAVNGVLNVYGKEGAFVRQIGRKGAGPGEYQRITNVLLGAGGEIHVIDGELARRTVFNRNGELLRTTSLVSPSPVPSAAVMLESGDIVMNVSLLDPAGVGFALQQLDRRGDRVRLFDEQPFDATQQWRGFRALANWPNNQVIVSLRYEYEFDVYSDGARKARYVRDADWFPPWRGPGQPSDGVLNVRPTTVVSAIWENEGLLWVLVSVPAAAWQPATATGLSPFVRGQRNPALAARPRYESIVEVIDLNRNVLVASTRLREPISGRYLGAGHIARYYETADGEPSLEVWRFTLKR